MLLRSLRFLGRNGWWWRAGIVAGGAVEQGTGCGTKSGLFLHHVQVVRCGRGAVRHPSSLFFR